ncbi:FtsX-like permease family protein [Accumulibacter sp.]|jgi:ABC-type lipoprotein release transport system permease subunit|uniref:ABC3 transporter permease C-terminal domain-containing protein n=1 Tax=Accumulibacter regalis TaxID=522306 RepID=C7RMF0_ACCRE|nr:FtsX-like permease family protein [Accumulibacter sp.]MBN8498268.1 ABC transporter permease [Accumulibacter sp.]MBO3717173.1 ABC transporter permease [Accumulibacter sp.]
MNAWIEKQKYLIDFTLSSLARRKAKNLGLLLVYTLIVFLLASVMLFTHALRQAAAEVLVGAPEVILQRMVAGRHDLIPPGYLERIGRIRGVQHKEGRLWGYYYDPVVKANYTFMVPGNQDIAAGTLLVGAGMARARGLAVGNLISFRSYSGKLFSFTIARILPHDSELVSADLVLISEADFRSFFAIAPGYFTDIALSVANPLEVRNVAAKLSQQFPDSRPILREEILRTYESIFNWREGIVLALASLAILAFAIFAWEKASGLSADEKREIGILKAIGWETGDVLKMKFWEGALVSLAAFLIGYLAAYLHVFRFSSSLFAPVLKGWAVLYPRFELSPVIDGFQVATLFFFTVFPYAAATLVPIWRAAIADPDAVMRG